MKKSIILLLSGLAVISLPGNALAWSKTAHQIIAGIAMHFLSNPAKQNLKQYLGATTPEEASVWMDEMKSKPAYDYMEPWHYIRIEKGASYAPSKEDNIINHIQQAFDELGKKGTLSPDQVKTDALVLFHLIGDIHQPLNVGYGADKGGSAVSVTFLSKPTNLQSVWDDEIIREQKISYDDCLRLFNTISVAQREKIKAIDFVGWMTETRALLPAVYDFPDHSVDEAYAQKNKFIILKQLLYAGMRLASALEQLFGTAPVNAGAATHTSNASGPAPEGKTVSPEDAIKHIGEQVTVCGKVYGGKFLNQSNGKYTFINIGARAPSNPFSVVIIGSDRDHFSYKPETYFDGKQICVSGTVTKYNGKAQIIISKEEQIRLK